MFMKVWDQYYVYELILQCLKVGATQMYTLNGKCFVVVLKRVYM